MIANTTINRLITETRGLSREDLIARLHYHAPHLTPEERTLASKVVSNTDAPVMIFRNPSILTGALSSRHSRLEGDIRTTLKIMAAKNPDLTTALVSMQIPDLLDGLGIDYFKRVFGEYGDDSVAQVVPVAVGFEGVSMLQAMNILHHRLLAGIEKSSRYMDFGRRNAEGKYNYHTDSLIVEAGLQEEFDQTMNALYDEYSALRNEKEGAGKRLRYHLTGITLPFEAFVADVRKTVAEREWEPATDDELRQAYDKTIKAMHIDNIRHTLPLAARTLLAVLMNAQGVRDLLVAGNSIPTGESIAIAELLRRECGDMGLLDDVDPLNSRGEAFVNHRYLTGQVGRLSFFQGLSTFSSQDYEGMTWSADDKLPRFSLHERELRGDRRLVAIKDSQTPFRVQVSTNNTLADIITAIIAQRNPVTFEDARAFVEQMPFVERLKLFNAYAGFSPDEKSTRGNRRHRPGRAFEVYNVDIGFLAPIAEIRDLRRHRILTNLDPVSYSAQHGFFLSKPIQSSGVGERLEQVYRTAAHMSARLAEAVNPYVASFALPLATMHPMNIAANLRELFHIEELRTQPGAHIVYKGLCQMLDAGMRRLLPVVEETMTFVDRKPIEIDYGRAVQELRSARRGA